MAYIAAAAALVTVIRYALAVRREGARVLWELAAAAAAGLLAGIWLGIAARGAMRVIAVAAGAAPRLTAEGSLRVLLFFALLGGGLALFYAGFFRQALGRNGLVFGLLLIAFTAWPFTAEALESVRPAPAMTTLVTSSGAVLAAMWLPYALLVAFFTPRLRRRLPATSSAPSAHPR